MDNIRVGKNPIAFPLLIAQYHLERMELKKDLLATLVSSKLIFTFTFVSLVTLLTM
jgi:hypothetical protein